MAAGSVRVMIVLPISQAWYFEPRRFSSIARKVKKALAVADRVDGGGIVDVILYGVSSQQKGSEPVVVHTEVSSKDLDQWVNDWAVRPSAPRGIFDDQTPVNKFEEHFGVEVDYHGRALPGLVVDEIHRSTMSTKGDHFVIFGLDWGRGLKELVRAVTKLDRPDIFWQFFGDAADIDHRDFWGRDDLKRGGVAPNVWAHLNTYWTPRSITRGFRKWRKARA
ncbi:VWA domain-containing protein [Streptomyces sp. NPDC056938]|uniref:VWA domain-containing protein n=1 Tax=unclassified Streptomyces TaxID=2593676 RepID=UPI00363B2EBA